jgi:shikimate kinase
MKPFFLIGFRGAGKTTLGKNFSALKNIPFLDLDEVFETKKKMTILAFIDQFGLEEFRREEEKILGEIINHLLAEKSATVVATGGGFVDWEPSLEMMLRNPFKKIYLNPNPEILWDRISPMVEKKTIGNLQDFPALLALWKKRDPLFRKIATDEIHAVDMSLALEALAKAVV